MGHDLHAVNCKRCGTEIVAHRSDALCRTCKVASVRRSGQDSEKRRRHPCPTCGAEVARSTKRCRACGNKDRVERLTGANNYAWKGGRTVDRHGYIHILVHAGNGSGRYRPEHQLVWEQANGKPLPKGWIVHHINGIKDDNRPENLTAASRIDHTRGDKRIEHLEAELIRLKEQKRNSEGPWKS